MLRELEERPHGARVKILWETEMKGLLMIKPSRVPLVQHDAIFPLSEGFVLTEEAGEMRCIFPLSPTWFLS